MLESVRCDEFIKTVAPDFGSFVERLRPVEIYHCSIRESFREPLAPHHCTPTVRELARAAGGSGGAAVMPVLADALMDAGCDNELILAHCRSGGEHEKGC